MFDTKPSGLHAYAACLVKLKQFDKAADVLPPHSGFAPRGRARTAPAGCASVDGSPAARRPVTLQPMLQAGNPTVDTLELAATAYEDLNEYATGSC